MKECKIESNTKYITLSRIQGGVMVLLNNVPIKRIDELRNQNVIIEYINRKSANVMIADKIFLLEECHSGTSYFVTAKEV